MNNEIIRHMLSTMSFRFDLVEKNRNSNFGKFVLSENTRKPVEILHHVNDVLNKTRLFVLGEKLDKSNLSMLDYDDEVKRFNELLIKFDSILEDIALEVDFSKK